MKFLTVWFKRSLMLAVLLLCMNTYAINSPIVTLKKATDNMLASLKANQLHLSDNRVIARIVNKNLVPAVDVYYMGASVIGRYWRGASADQRSLFVRKFKTILINTYSAALSSYDGDVVRFFPIRVNYNKLNMVSVRSVIIRRSGQRIPITYNVLRRDNKWLVYDFSIENISIVQSYRAQFAGILADGGLAKLNSRLKQHNR